MEEEKKNREMRDCGVITGKIGREEKGMEKREWEKGHWE